MSALSLPTWMVCILTPLPLQPVQLFTLVPPFPPQSAQTRSRVAASFLVCRIINVIVVIITMINYSSQYLQSEVKFIISKVFKPFHYKVPPASLPTCEPLALFCLSSFHLWDYNSDDDLLDISPFVLRMRISIVWFHIIVVTTSHASHSSHPASEHHVEDVHRGTETS